MVEALAETLTEGVTGWLTVMVTAFDVAGFPVTQLALDVRIQVITSLLARLLLEYVELFVPILVPFIFH
jgi:hypothetical protein